MTQRHRNNPDDNGLQRRQQQSSTLSPRTRTTILLIIAINTIYIIDSTSQGARSPRVIKVDCYIIWMGAEFLTSMVFSANFKYFHHASTLTSTTSIINITNNRAPRSSARVCYSAPTPLGVVPTYDTDSLSLSFCHV